MSLSAMPVSLLALVVAIFAIAGSAAAERGQGLSGPDTTAPARTKDIRVGPLDKLKIDMVGVPSLSGDYQVDQAGFLKLPLIGEIHAGGFTLSELASLIQTHFEGRYSQRPGVTVLVLESTGAAEGAAKKPGM